MKKILASLLLASSLVAANATPIEVASIEFNPKFMQLDSNITGIASRVTEAAKHGAKLIVLPETATSGYIYTDRKQIDPYLDTIPGKTTDTMAKIAKQYHVYIAIGIAEKDPVTGQAYNSAALIGPEGYIGKYRKNQLNSSDNKWASRGNLGFPVFDTEIGKIALLICYDDMHLQSILVPDLRGANILAYLTSSDILPKYEKGSDSNHSTIANISTMAGWSGLNIVASNRTGNETNPANGDVTHFVGGASIWKNDGTLLAAAPSSSWTNEGTAKIIYATIDPQAPSIQQNYWLKHRRPELYTQYNYYRAPFDPNADLTPHQITSLLIQYTPTNGDINKNYDAIQKLIESNNSVFNLVVLPFNSFLGEVNINKDNRGDYAEALGGKSYNLASKLAAKYRTLLLFSMVEKYQGKYYETVVIFNSDGKQIGIYRKSHLNNQEQTWATQGNDLPVFSTPIGRIAIMLNDEVRIPEITDIYALKRANIIAIPVSYNQKDYGGNVNIPKGLVPDNSNKGMYMWYNIAKYSQTDVLVANYINGSERDIGQSAWYSRVPEEGYFAPDIAPSTNIAYSVSFTTNVNSTLWQNQERLVIGRRDDLSVPLTYTTDNKCFKNWTQNSTSINNCSSQ